MTSDGQSGPKSSASLPWRRNHNWPRGVTVMLNIDWKPPTIETPRLILRALDVDDAADIFLFCSNPRMTRYTLWNTHETIKDSQLFLSDYRMLRYPNSEPDPIGIILKDD